LFLLQLLYTSKTDSHFYAFITPSSVIGAASKKKVYSDEAEAKQQSQDEP